MGSRENHSFRLREFSLSIKIPEHPIKFSAKLCPTSFLSEPRVHNPHGAHIKETTIIEVVHKPCTDLFRSSFSSNTGVFVKSSKSFKKPKALATGMEVVLLHILGGSSRTCMDCADCMGRAFFHGLMSSSLNCLENSTTGIPQSPSLGSSSLSESTVISSSNELDSSTCAEVSFSRFGESTVTSTKDRLRCLKRFIVLAPPSPAIPPPVVAEASP
nr:hypothetical protein Iba_chr08eCG6800 [Ipomoea batatas]